MNRLHFSQIKEIRVSPAHFRHCLTASREDTPAMRIGRAVHRLALEGVEPNHFEGIRRGADWELHVARASALGVAKEDILSQSERVLVDGMATSIQNHQDARDVLAGATEAEKGWEAMICGIPCAGKIDLLGPVSLDELKTTACAAPKKFLRDAEKMWYDAQLAWYQMAMGVEYIGPDTQWLKSRIIAVENKAPYVVQVFELDNLRLDQGAEKCIEAIRLYKACIEGMAWPAYSSGVVRWDGEIKFEQEDEE